MYVPARRRNKVVRLEKLLSAVHNREKGKNTRKMQNDDTLTALKAFTSKQGRVDGGRTKHCLS